MTLKSLFRSPGALAAVSTLALGAGIFTFSAKADGWDKKTVLTVSETIQVRDTVLDPGKYVFKLLDSQSDRHVVQIFNADQTHIYGTILAIPKEKLDASGHSEFTFWETPPGVARAMRAWFYPGDTIGQEFPYPKHLKQIAMVTTSSAVAAPPLTLTPAPATVSAEPTVETQSEQQSQAEEQTVTAQQPTQMAEVTPPAETVAPAPEPAPSAPPAELPKTASPYPLIGLSGLALLALSGLLKLQRAS